MCILKYMPHYISRVESLSYMVKVARPIMHSVCGVALLTSKCDVLSSQEIGKRKWEQVLPANYDIT